MKNLIIFTLVIVNLTTFFVLSSRTTHAYHGDLLAAKNNESYGNNKSWKKDTDWDTLENDDYNSDYDNYNEPNTNDQTPEPAYDNDEHEYDDTHEEIPEPPIDDEIDENDPENRDDEEEPDDNPEPSDDEEEEEAEEPVSFPETISDNGNGGSIAPKSDTTDDSKVEEIELSSILSDSPQNIISIGTAVNPEKLGSYILALTGNTAISANHDYKYEKLDPVERNELLAFSAFSGAGGLLVALGSRVQSLKNKRKNRALIRPTFL